MFIQPLSNLLDKSSPNQCNSNDDNDIYDTSELEHEFEYGIYEVVLKTEQLMAELKRIDEVENEKQEITGCSLWKFSTGTVLRCWKSS